MLSAERKYRKYLNCFFALLLCFVCTSLFCTIGILMFSHAAAGDFIASARSVGMASHTQPWQEGMRRLNGIRGVSDCTIIPNGRSNICQQSEFFVATEWQRLDCQFQCWTIFLNGCCRFYHIQNIPG